MLEKQGEVVPLSLTSDILKLHGRISLFSSVWDWFFPGPMDKLSQPCQWHLKYFPTLYNLWRGWAFGRRRRISPGRNPFLQCIPMLSPSQHSKQSLSDWDFLLAARSSGVHWIAAWLVVTLSIIPSILLAWQDLSSVKKETSKPYLAFIPCTAPKHWRCSGSMEQRKVWYCYLCWFECMLYGASTGPSAVLQHWSLQRL